MLWRNFINISHRLTMQNMCIKRKHNLEIINKNNRLININRNISLKRMRIQSVTIESSHGFNIYYI